MNKMATGGWPLLACQSFLPSGRLPPVSLLLKGHAHLSPPYFWISTWPAGGLPGASGWPYIASGGGCGVCSGHSDNGKPFMWSWWRSFGNVGLWAGPWASGIFLSWDSWPRCSCAPYLAPVLVYLDSRFWFIQEGFLSGLFFMEGLGDPGCITAHSGFFGGGFIFTFSNILMHFCTHIPYDTTA